jgi:cytidylate kinase
VIVAIAGPIGVGKSTVGRGLANRLGYAYISGGEMFREIARERGISVTDVNKLAEGDPGFDRDLDRRQREAARAAGNCVVESRLSGWMVDADLKIWLRAPLEVRAARVADREGKDVDAAHADLVERERSEWARYKASYHIDIDDLSPYHLVVDTTRWNADAIVDALLLLVRAAGQPAARTRGSEEARS